MPRKTKAGTNIYKERSQRTFPSRTKVVRYRYFLEMKRASKEFKGISLKGA
jgi:hypothetical protein